MSNQNDGADSSDDDVVFIGRQKRQIQTPQWLRNNGEAGAAAIYGFSGNRQVTESSSVWGTEDQNSDDDQDCSTERDLDTQYLAVSLELHPELPDGQGREENGRGGSGAGSAKGDAARRQEIARKGRQRANGLLSDARKRRRQEKEDIARMKRTHKTVKEAVRILGPFLEKLLDRPSSDSRTELEIKCHKRRALADAEKAKADAEKAEADAEKAKADAKLYILRRAREEMDDLMEHVEEIKKEIEIQKAKPGGGNQRIIEFLESDLARSCDVLEELSRER